MSRAAPLPLLILTTLAMSAPAIAADDPVFSGPQPGEKLVPFEVQGVYDELAGKKLDFIERADGAPTLIVFVHDLTRPGFALTRSITRYAEQRSDDGAHAFVVWLSDDRSAAKAYLKRARKSLSLNVPVGISLHGAEGPGAYGLNRNVELTILVAEENKVTANFALVQPSVTDAPEIAAALVERVGGEAPSQKEMTTLAHPGRGDGRMRRRAMEADARLRGLMRRLVADDASAEQVRKAAEAVEKHVGEDANKRQQVVRLAGAILRRDLGTEAAQQQLRRWREKYREAEKNKNADKGDDSNEEAEGDTDDQKEGEGSRSRENNGEGTKGEKKEGRPGEGG